MSSMALCPQRSWPIIVCNPKSKHESTQRVQTSAKVTMHADVIGYYILGFHATVLANRDYVTFG